MHIYLSGSISGGREDQPFYARIADALEAAGHSVDRGNVTNPELGAEGESLPAVEIFRRDLAAIDRVAEARGIVVAEVSRPSHGVGYEVAYAVHVRRMPVIALWRVGDGRRCSAMIEGSDSVRLIRYESEAGAIAALLDMIQSCE